MKIALVDTRISQASERGLEKRGFYVLKMPPAKGISAPMASHPDMLLAKLGDNIVTTADYIETAPYIFSDIREYAPHIKIHVTDEVYAENYPKDAILNVLTVGKRMYAKTDSVSKYVLTLARELGYEIVNTRQGYPACTALALSEKDALTADRGLALTLGEWGVSVCLIENGGISLPPYEYGFIGGACGVLGADVYFLGNPLHHPSYGRIEKELCSLGMRAIALSDEPLSDLGKIIFL